MAAGGAAIWVFSIIVAGESQLAAGDWPQILGPTRTGQAEDESPIPRWDADRLRAAWTVNLGQGYAGVAVAAGRVVGFHRVGDQETVTAWEHASGQRLWSRSFPADYSGGYNPDHGPRCVPLLAEGRVFLFGAAGDLHCVDAKDGAPIWSRPVYREFRGREGYFGAGSTPILAGGKLLLNVGGRNAGIVALDPATGKTLWQQTDEDASYSSPTLASFGGMPSVVFVTRYKTLAIEPQSGRTLFQFPFGKRGPTVNAATPLVFDGHLFITASYGVGAKLVRPQEANVRTIWSNDESLSSQYTTPVHHQGYLYGSHGREDLGVSEYRCVAAKTGEVRWRSDKLGVAHTLLIGNQLLIVDVNGRLVLAAAAPDRFQLHAEAEISREKVRAIPAYSEGRLFIRDSESLRCFVLAQ